LNLVDLNGQPIAPPPTNCSSGYTPYGENCFIVQKLDAGRKNYADAKAKCQSLGDRRGDMATVVDNYENSELRVLLHEMMRTTGVSDAKAWMGMQEHMGQYSWDNLCPVTFSDFENLFARPGRNLSCVQMISDGKWDATSCDTEADYVLCERRFGMPINKSSQNMLKVHLLSERLIFSKNHQKQISCSYIRMLD
jgi:hypothetical protein